MFCINGSVKADGNKYHNRFLFDTGYQRALLLDSVLMQQQNFPKDLPVIKTTRLTNGEGRVFVTNIVNVERLDLGGAKAKDVPTQLLTTDNPARFPCHFLGNELLMRFNTILDFQENCVYLKANSRMDAEYVDAKQ